MISLNECLSPGIKNMRRTVEMLGHTHSSGNKEYSLSVAYLGGVVNKDDQVTLKVQPGLLLHHCRTLLSEEIGDRCETPDNLHYEHTIMKESLIHVFGKVVKFRNNLVRADTCGGDGSLNSGVSNTTATRSLARTGEVLLHIGQLHTPGRSTSFRTLRDALGSITKVADRNVLGFCYNLNLLHVASVGKCSLENDENFWKPLYIWVPIRLIMETHTRSPEVSIGVEQSYAEGVQNFKVVKASSEQKTTLAMKKDNGNISQNLVVNTHLRVVYNMLFDSLSTSTIEKFLISEALESLRSRILHNMCTPWQFPRACKALQGQNNSSQFTPWNEMLVKATIACLGVESGCIVQEVYIPNTNLGDSGLCGNVEKANRQGSFATQWSSQIQLLTCNSCSLCNSCLCEWLRSVVTCISALSTKNRSQSFKESSISGKYSPKLATPHLNSVVKLLVTTLDIE
jgi:hypothetical protein